jgi:hypothetical protein
MLLAHDFDDFAFGRELDDTFTPFFTCARTNSLPALRPARRLNFASRATDENTITAAVNSCVCRINILKYGSDLLLKGLTLFLIPFQKQSFGRATACHRSDIN